MAYGIPGANPSLIAQQQRISALPSDPKETVLAKYLVQLAQQNKVGTPEYYMAAGEFQKRESMRKEQAAKQQQGPNVVQNITAKAVEKLVPQMAVAAPISRGVGALDAGGMERIASPVYTGAMGGIVAFDEGGQAKSDVTADQIEQLYSTELGRKSDPEGYRFWSEKFGPEVTADERALFIAEAAPEVQRRMAAGDTGLPDYMKVDPNVRRALQSKDITTDEYKALANYFGNQWIGGEAEDPASLTRRDYIERPRTGYDLATFLATRSQQHGAAPDTKQRMTNLIAPFVGKTGSMRAASDEGTGVYVTNPMTGETELANPLGVDNMYRVYRPPHQGTIGDPEKGSRYAVGMDYRIDPETGEAYYVGPYTGYYKDLGHRDWQGPASILASGLGMYLFPGMDFSSMAARGLLSLGTEAAGRMAKGGEVKRYQGVQGSVVRMTPQPATFTTAMGNPLGAPDMQMQRAYYISRGLPLPFDLMTEEERRRISGPQPATSELRARLQAGIDQIPGNKPAPIAAPAATAPGAAADITPPALPPTAPPRAGIESLGPLNFTDIAKQAQQAGLELIGPARTTRPEVPTNVEAVRDVRDTFKAAGYNFDLFKDQIKDLEKQKEQLALDRKDAANLRILEAGLGILGGESPYAFVNIGKGASPALKGFTEDVKELKKLERDRQKNIRDIQIAENQIAAGIGEKAQNRLDKAQERQDKFDSDERAIKASMTTSIIQALNSRDIANFNAKVQTNVAEIGRASTIDTALRKQAQDAAIKIVDNSMTGKTMSIAQRDAEIERLTAVYYEQLKNLSSGRAAPAGAGNLVKNPDGTFTYQPKK